MLCRCPRTTPRSTSQDNFQPHQEDDTTEDGIGDQRTGVTSRARTTPRSTRQDNFQPHQEDNTTKDGMTGDQMTADFQPHLEDAQMIQTTIVTEEAGTDTFRLVRQVLYTGSCDLVQDGATATSIGTLERQGQQDNLKHPGSQAPLQGEG